MERNVLELEKEIKQARKQTLNLIESAFGESSKWPFIRSQILRIFGTDGLSKLTKSNVSKKTDTSIS